MIHASVRPLVVLLAAAIVLAAAPRVWAYTPEDPKVQAILERAVTFLETTDPRAADFHSQTMGFRMLVAYAIYKHREDAEHPKVVEAIALAKQQMANGRLSEKEVYELGVAISFLTELGREDTQKLAEAMCARLMKEQTSRGGWTYTPNGPNDTSLTQYAMLGLWSAKDAALNVGIDPARIAAAANWLLRTQAPDGSWAYLGKDPGSFTRIPQEDRASLSTFAAGAGSLYIAVDALGLKRQAPNASPFVAVPKPGEKKVELDRERVFEALDLADRFWAVNGRLMSKWWQFYYMYAQERYLSFRNKVRGIKEPENGPAWYNAGVDYLATAQNKDGSFRNVDNPAGPLADTAFAVLFLLRTTKERLPTLTGTLSSSSGPGVPPLFWAAQQTPEGEVHVPAGYNQIEGILPLIKMIQSDDPIIGEPPHVDPALTKAPIKPSELEILKQTVARDPSFQKRLLAVKVLAGRGLDDAPILIFALSDPDYRVAVVARDALRRMSGKVKGFRLPDQPTRDQKEMAQKRWSQWLKKVRPDLEF